MNVVGIAKLLSLFGSMIEPLWRMIRILQEQNEEGIDPHDIFMNSTLNVMSGFTLGKTFDYEDLEFQQLSQKR